MTEAVADRGGAGSADFEQRLRRWSRRLLGGGLLIMIAHAFVPLSEFVHRGDDAFYYFKLAINFPTYGFWTFDGINPSNGVQPLWGMLLTAVAVVLDWVGVTDVHVIARLFVLLTGLVHFASCMLLFHLLARFVSLGAGIAAAGAFLFPLGIVWTRVWGMENSLYSLILLATVLHYLGRFREQGTARAAAWLGALLGLLTLARLNAGFLIPTMLLFYLCGRWHGSLGTRLKRCVVIGAVASALIVPWLVYNLVHTGHLLPVSGGAKQVRTALFMQEQGIESVFSAQYLSAVSNWLDGPIQWFVGSRALDGTWLAGGRAILGEDKGDYTLILQILCVVLLAPLLTLRVGGWLRELRAMLSRLAPFAFLLVFAVFNIVLALFMFPSEITYSVVRWWLIEGEIVITSLMAVLVATSLGFMGAAWVPRRAALGLATAWIALLVAFHGARMVEFYWDGEGDFPDWNVSTNDERYQAGIWIRDNLPDDAVVGSWNAGVIGYYSDRHVVNLDGLINSWEFVPYLESGRLADYILEEGIEYLTDTNFELNYRQGAALKKDLILTPVYRRYMDIARTGKKYRDQAFWVYRVDGPRRR
ncbi:MAG: hypothetical protein ACYTCU_03525 [Planctomycetota bacterium]|jgi:hypothetical protein